MAKKLKENPIIKRWEDKYEGLELFPENNKAIICGKIERDLDFNHRLPGTKIKIFKTRVKVTRNNEYDDYVPILIPETIIDEIDIKGKWIRLAGTVITRRGRANNDHRFKAVAIYVKYYELIDKAEVKYIKPINIVYIEGMVCKVEAMYSTKADLVIGVKAKNGEGCYYYLPTVAFGRKLENFLALKHGDKIAFYAKFQSRQYTKRISETEVISKTAYELATNDFCLLD